MLPAFAYYLATAVGLALLGVAIYGLVVWSSFWAGALFAVLVFAGVAALLPAIGIGIAVVLGSNVQ